VIPLVAVPVFAASDFFTGGAAGGFGCAGGFVCAATAQAHSSAAPTVHSARFKMFGPEGGAMGNALRGASDR